MALQLLPAADSPRLLDPHRVPDSVSLGPAAAARDPGSGREQLPAGSPSGSLLTTDPKGEFSTSRATDVGPAGPNSGKNLHQI